MPTVTINSILCNSTSNDGDHDDVFIMYQSDGGPPIRYPYADVQKMLPNSTWNVENSDGDAAVSFDYDYAAYICLWDQDGPFTSLNAPDILGNGYFIPSSVSGTPNFGGHNGSSYTVDISIS